MNPHTSAETKNLCFKPPNEVNTLIRLLWASCKVSFLLLKLVLRVIKLPEWHPATISSFFIPVLSIHVIVSVYRENSTLSWGMFQNFNEQSSETVTNSLSLSLIIWLIPEPCSSIDLTGCMRILSLAWAALASGDSILSKTFLMKLREFLFNRGMVA